MTCVHGKAAMLQRNKGVSAESLRQPRSIGGARRMSSLPSAHLLVVAFERLLVAIEHARIAARAAALLRVGLTRRDGRSFTIAHCNDSGIG
jgi:hypothetical protein